MAEENVGKLFVIVLARLDGDRLDVAMALGISSISGTIWGRLGRRTDNVQVFRRGLIKRSCPATKLSKTFEKQSFGTADSPFERKKQ